MTKAPSDIKTKEAQVKMVDKIMDYLSVRLGTNIWANDSEYQMDRVDVESEEINSQVFGIFRHIISKMKVVVTSYRTQENKDCWIARVNFDYHHPDGGSNGHSLPFRLVYYESNNSLKEQVA